MLAPCDQVRQGTKGYTQQMSDPSVEIAHESSPTINQSCQSAMYLSLIQRAPDGQVAGCAAIQVVLRRNNGLHPISHAYSFMATGGGLIHAGLAK